MMTWMQGRRSSTILKHFGILSGNYYFVLEYIPYCINQIQPLDRVFVTLPRPPPFRPTNKLWLEPIVRRQGRVRYSTYLLPIVRTVR